MLSLGVLSRCALAHLGISTHQALAPCPLLAYNPGQRRVCEGDLVMANGGASAWESRLVQGVVSMGVASEASDGLISAFGALGCEAEFGLSLIQAMAELRNPSRGQGEHWLRQCAALAQRLTRVAAEFGVATQAYLDALVAVEHATQREMITGQAHDAWAARFDSTPDVWWPERGDIALGGEPIEMWLRRAGFAYRHSVSIGLPGHIEALGDALGLVLHALRTLPPGGILSRASLHLGLSTLAAEIEGDLVPRHILDLNDRHVGLLTGIATLLRFAAIDRTGVEGDIIWARGELDRARATIVGSFPATGGPRVTRPLTTPTGNLWARQIVVEWEGTLVQLEAIRVASPPPSRPTRLLN